MLSIVIVSDVEAPVSPMPDPAVNVRVSLLLSAAIVVAPTTTFLKMFCAEPVSVFVIVSTFEVDAYEALIPVPPVTALPNPSTADSISVVNATVPVASLNVIVLSCVGSVKLSVVS